MKKRIIVITLVLAIMTGVFAVTAAASTLAANPTASTVYVNGTATAFEAYNISGNNYFKLRDLMEAIDVFVGYDNATKAITLDTSKGYEPEVSATPTPTPTPTPPSGSIDSAILGNWIDETTSLATRYYTFNSDGTFKYLEFEGSHASSTEGKYTTSNGKVYFTDLVSSIGL